jgi:hypothetical protein
MVPFHPALRIALSTASALSQPWSGMTSGRYVAVRVSLELNRGRYADEDNGEGALEDGGYNDGFGKLM